MNKVTACCLFSLASVLFSAPTFADETLTGEIYNVMAKNTKVTDEFCKAHVPDTFKTNASEVYKHIKGDNGVEAKELSAKTKEEGGVYFRSGKTELTGTYEGKPWKETVFYFAQALDKTSGVQQGVWYTKDCKGFYKVTA